MTTERQFRGTMARVNRLMALVLMATVAGCGGGSATSSAPTRTPTPTQAQVLSTGKDVVALEAGTYRSPAGFLPAVTVQVPAGWSSVHRYDDAFDITMPDPSRDAPAVALIWMTPSAPTAAEALAGVRTAAGSSARPITGRIGTGDALGLDISDGTGSVVESVRKGIGIDAEKGQRLRVLTTDVAGKPLVVVVLVPIAAGWDTYAAKAQQLLDSVRPV